MEPQVLAGLGSSLLIDLFIPKNIGNTCCVFNNMLTKIKNTLRSFGILEKSEYGKEWQHQGEQWYSEIFNEVPLLHKDFIRFLNEKKNIQTILEIGCGNGIYPIKFKELFSNTEYSGIDMSQFAITYCKNNSPYDFVCGDFLKMEINKKYDLVFSNSVIDHIYDIDLFISKIIQTCKKYAYICSYRGYFPNLTKHKMRWWDAHSCYLNDLSVKQTKKILLENGLTEDEFVIRPQTTGNTRLPTGTVIEINRKILR